MEGGTRVAEETVWFRW